MLFYRFPLKIGQKSAYNQRKAVVFYRFPLKKEYFCFLVSRMVISRMACLGFVGTLHVEEWNEKVGRLS